ncbi:hypothetical protein C8Q72DRAFT_895125 [Fomitopsis betulina]|nr:hypothetical protein C8Q72DRAFT_895125 [Fomitopsis betulina]
MRVTPQWRRRDSGSLRVAPAVGHRQASSPLEGPLDEIRHTRRRVESPSPPPNRASLRSTELHVEEGDQPSSVSEDDESGHTVTLEELVDEPYWVAKGKVAGQMAEMFDSFRPILEQGMLRKPGVDENTIHASLANEHFHSFQVICLVVPKLAKVFDEADVAGMLGPKLVSKLHSLLRKGRSDARNADISTIKKIYSVGAPALNGNLQRLRHTKAVVITIPSAAASSVLRISMINIRSGKLVLTTDDLPCFLWAGCVRQRGQGTTFVGFLRGELLISGFLAIHISPGAAKGDIRTTRGGNASLHDISFVTLESVVYIAVLVHFGLSSQPNFSAGNETDGQFLYSDFYRKILDMANKMTHTEKGDLIDWWNENIFPDARCTRRSTATTRKTILEEMEDELEAA